MISPKGPNLKDYSKRDGGLTHIYTSIIVRLGLESRRAPHGQGPSYKNNLLECRGYWFLRGVLHFDQPRRSITVPLSPRNHVFKTIILGADH